jgi:hypothetical protein
MDLRGIMIEELTVDRSKWPPGPWDAEQVDKESWVDPQTGLSCLICRNESGAWCGYVGVPRGYRLFGVHCERANIGIPTYMKMMELTFSSSMLSHCVDTSHLDTRDVWWLGFDCNHRRGRPLTGGVVEYCRVGDVKKDVTRLASIISRTKKLQGDENLYYKSFKGFVLIQGTVGNYTPHGGLEVVLSDENGKEHVIPIWESRAPSLTARLDGLGP